MDEYKVFVFDIIHSFDPSYKVVIAKDIREARSFVRKDEKDWRTWIDLKEYKEYPCNTPTVVL